MSAIEITGASQSKKPVKDTAGTKKKRSKHPEGKRGSSSTKTGGSREKGKRKEVVDVVKVEDDDS